MSLSIYQDPFDYMDRQLSRVFGEQDWQGLAAAQRHAQRGPRMDLIEKEKEYVANFEIPGMSKEEINVDIHNNVLSISGESKRQQEYEKDKYRMSERFYGQFSRSITLPQNIDQSKVHAKYENGLLQVSVSKTEAASARKIAID